MGSTPAPTVSLLNQVLPNPNVLPYVQQANFGAMIGAVASENPDLDFSDIQVELNKIVRQIYDRRTWMGMMVRGQIATTGFTTAGTVNLTNGNPYVQGVGTSWTPAITGQQFRMFALAQPMTILFVNESTQTLTLEMPWAGPSYTNTGYFIAQYFYTMGPNIKYIHTAKNMLMAWRMWLNLTQQSLDAMDPWRQTTFTPCALVQMPLDQNGGYQVELWPVPSIVQPLPFIAVVQPPNLINDGDSLPAYIRCDIVVDMGRAWAKTYRGPKINKYYDAGESQRLLAKSERELVYMAKADENLLRQDILYDWESFRFAPLPGRTQGWAINTAVPSGDDKWDW